MKKSTFNYLLIFTALLFALKMQAQDIPGLTRYDRPDGVTLARWVNTNAVVVDSENRVWVGTQGQGGNHPGVLACLTEGTWEVFTSQNSGLPSDTIYSLVSFEDRLYIGTSQGMAIYDGNWELISPNDGLAGRHVFSLFLDTEKIIAGTENGLSVFSNGTWQNFNTGNSGLINDTVQAITHDGSGALWLGTRDGISVYHNGVWTAYHSQNSTLTAPDIRALKFDGYGNLWVGTMQNGLFKFTNGQFYPASELFKFTRDDYDVHSFVVNEEGDIFTSIRFQGSQYLVK
jgi:ligand-binding sensor domain-containing protein